MRLQILLQITCLLLNSLPPTCGYGSVHRSKLFCVCTEIQLSYI